MAIFKCAAWRPIGTNQGGSMSSNIGLLLHHQAGNGSLYGFFSNPKSEVSAHFWVGKSGVIEQYVDSSKVAWHAKSANSSYCGVETEGCPGGADEPLTAQQINSLGVLYAEGARVHGWINALANAMGQKGFGYHRMAVNTACPCDMRLAKRPEILAVAFGDVPPSNPSAPVPPPAPVPPGNAPPFPGTLLRDFTQGQGTQQWQGQMAARGWAISVDDMYGSQSAAVCRKFQIEKGLGVDGIVGPETWAASWNAPVT